MNDYLDRHSGMIANVPGSLLSGTGGQVSYAFDCDIHEGVFPEQHEQARHGSLDKVGHLSFTFPAAYRQKTLSLLDFILEGQPADEETDVRRIFCWVLENLSYANTPLRDHLILDTGFGTCVQLTRLFANLVRLRGVPVREQCGALMLRQTSDCVTESVSREYSPFTHTWAEVYSESRSWFPVELIAMRYGNRESTPANVSPALRRESIAQGAQFSNYYFGSIDPYSVYTGSLSNKLPPIVPMNSASGADRHGDLLKSVHHRLKCSIRYC